ncbi:hypothetical protein AB0B25_15815 [Nocardia sp. NPDC049190]|uniref:hypothetical protein n=1 Tax=Nocardia sp. NPDC049190 TaxID=3155650 RepID=UPI0033E54F81
MSISRQLIEAVSAARNQLSAAIKKASTALSRKVRGVGSTADSSAHTFGAQDIRNRDSFDEFDEFDDLSALMRAVQEPAGELVVTGLGRDVDIRLAATPKTMAKARALLEDEWTIRYGPKGRGSASVESQKRITIDGKYKGDVEEVMRSLSHEFGHASYPDDIPFPEMEDEFLQWHEIAKRHRALGEGEATLSVDEAALEAHARGITAAIRASGKLRDICDQHWRGEISRDDAREKIAEAFQHRRPASGKYSSYAEKWYKEHLDGWERFRKAGIVTSRAPE